MTIKELSVIREKLLVILSVALLINMAIIGVFSIIPGTVFGDVEPNDNMLQAEEITAGIHTGELNLTDNYDFYKIEVPSGSIINITFSSDTTTTDMVLTLSDNNGYFKFDIYSSNNVQDTDEYYVANETLTSDWYIDLSYGIGNYSFTVTITPQNDGGSGKDAAGNFPGALEINANTNINGMIGDDDTYDFFKIYVANGSKVNISFTSNSVSSQSLDLYDSNELYMDGTHSSNGVESYFLKNKNFAENPEYWFIQISGYDSSYTFKVTITKHDKTPPKIFNISVNAQAYSVQISWETDVPTNGTVFYGTDLSYGYSVGSYSYYLSTSHYTYTYDAVEGVKYHFKIVAYNEVGVRAESPDDTFIVPRSSFVTSQYNSLRTLIFAQITGDVVGSDVTFTVYCFDKGTAITPDTIKATSGTDVTNISLKSPSTGTYTGTYKLSQADIDNNKVSIFIDLTHKGNNDTVVYTNTVGEVPEEDDWEVELSYMDAADMNARFGEEITLKVIVTKDNKKADPENLTVSVSEYYYDRARYGESKLPTKRIDVGEYQVSYTFPEEGNDSTEFQFEAEIENGEDMDWDYLDHELNIFNLWYHQINLDNDSAEFDIYVTDLDNQIIPSALIEITLTYYSYSRNGGTTQNKTTDATGKARFLFNFPGLTDDWIDIYGSATANGKTQFFTDMIDVPIESAAPEDPEPYGADLEIYPLSDEEYDIYGTTYYTSPDTDGNIQKDFQVFSDYQKLANTTIYYYVIAGDMTYYGYYGGTGTFELIKSGDVTTDANGKITLTFKESKTRRSNIMNYKTYSIFIEAAIGTFEDVSPYVMVTSIDGNYYAEAMTYVITTGDATSISTAFKDIFSSDIKITIPKLNHGSQTDIEVKYTGTIVNPQVFVLFLPGEVSSDSLIMEFDPAWGQFAGQEVIYLSKDGSSYKGKFTIPAFMPNGKFTIMVVVQNILGLSSVSSFYFYDFMRLNWVVLGIGDSVEDGSSGGTPDEKPEPTTTDSDGDKYTDAIEDSFNTDPQDPYEYPGSGENEAREKKTVNKVEITIVGTTSGDISMLTVPEDEVPDVPEKIGKDFNLFLNITCDEECTNIQIVLELGKIGEGIIPEGTDPKAIKLFFYDEEKEEWTVIEKSSYNPDTGILSATIDHLTVFSPMSSKAHETSDEGDEGFPIIIVGIIAVVVIVVILAIVAVAIKKKKKGKGPETDRTDRVQEPGTDEDIDDRDEEPELKDKDEEKPDSDVDLEAEKEIPEPEDQDKDRDIDKKEEDKESLEKDEKIEEGKDLDEDKQDETKETAESEKDTVKTEAEEEVEKEGKSEPEKEDTSDSESEPSGKDKEEPEKKDKEAKTVPCPVCKKDLEVYSSPCPHCGTNMNW